MPFPNFEDLWSRYAAPRPRNPALALGGLAAAAGGTLFSIPTCVDATVVNETITWSNTAASSGTPLHVPFGGAGGQFKGYYIKSATLNPPQGKGPAGGVRASVGSFITNGNPTHGLMKLYKGSVITAGDNFHAASNITPFNAPLNVVSGTQHLGNFGLNKTYYAGFKTSGGRLGFIQLSVGNNGTNSPFPDEFTVLSYETNSTPGDPITIQQESVPEPTAEKSMIPLLLLAGAYGSLKAWRKKRQAVA